MLDLYLVRHAQSEMNLEAHLIGGRSNHVPLSPIGELQGSYLGKRFRNERVRFSRIYSSTAVRTQKTAHLTSHEIEFPVNKIILSEDLLELDQGDWEGQPRSEIYTSEMLAMINANNWEFTPPHGESQRMVEERMYSVVERNLLCSKTRNSCYFWPWDGYKMSFTENFRFISQYDLQDGLRKYLYNQITISQQRVALHFNE